MKKTSNELAVLSRCKQQLMQIQDLPELLKIRDQSMAIEKYAKTREEGYDAALEAKMVAFMAEARCGQVIRKMQAAGELRTKDGGNRSLESQAATLNDHGLTKSDSSRMQQAADVLDKNEAWFEATKLECKIKGRDFTRQMVIRESRRLKNEELLEEDLPETPRGKYDVIVIDPPWPMEIIDTEQRPNQSGFHYPTMNEDQLANFTIGKRKKTIDEMAADDCHMWCWTTQKFLPMALRLIPVWGFKYVCTFVWHKPGGFQPFNLPQYNCEFAVYARKGAPKFKTTKAFPTCFEAPRGEHSEKPEEFYEMVRRVTDGKRFDIFNRRKIKGFKGWGNESTR